MATFLLTGKALKNFKKSVMPVPQIIPYFDGWYVDIFTLERKKAVLITHERSFLSFVCYLTEVGGSQKIFEWFLNEFDSFLIQHDQKNRDRVMYILSKTSSFHKTRSRKVIGHMTDFKNLIQHGDRVLGTEGLRKVTTWLHDVPVCVEGKEYGRPKELLLTLLEK